MQTLTLTASRPFLLKKECPYYSGGGGVFTIPRVCTSCCLGKRSEKLYPLKNCIAMPTSFASLFPQPFSNFPSRPNHPPATPLSPLNSILWFPGIYAKCRPSQLHIQKHRPQKSKQESRTPSSARRSTPPRNSRPNSYSCSALSQGSVH